MEEAGGVDEGFVDGGGYAYGDGGDDYEEYDHCSLDVIGYEGDFEAAKCCYRVSMIEDLRS